jgi:photosynthetic reaction center cytochrome c subunit
LTRSRAARTALLAALALPLLLGCHRSKVEQRGFRGTGMLELYSPAAQAAQAEVNQVPVALPNVKASGRTAGEAFQNVQLLGDLSTGQFARLMLSFSNWVGGGDGCNYCHAAPDFASDAKYTKVIAREMIRMTRHINNDWKAHVVATGVTCYTCHRGQPVPARTWFLADGGGPRGMFVRKSSARPQTRSAALTVLPNDPLRDYLLEANAIPVAGRTALPTGNRHSIRQAESTYSMMIVMSESLGVNCTFCHNTRSFYSWTISTPQRVTAWHGIRLARELNKSYLEPLLGKLPANRLGPTGDVPKVYCATCHRGTNKPLNGISMLKDFPELAMPNAPLAAPSVPATTAAVAAPVRQDAG